MKKLKNKLSLLFIFLSTTLLFIGLITPSSANAQVGEGGCGSEEVYTAIGCVPVGDEQPFTEFILGWGVGIAGGIALILIVVAGIMFTTSGGDPKRMQAAKELLTAAIGGLLLLLFGVFILEFIGVDILNIPDFGN
jgi:hypothetical protein